VLLSKKAMAKNHCFFKFIDMKDILIKVLVLFCVIMAYRSCKKNNELELLQKQLSDVSIDNNFLSQERDNLGRQVTSANQTILTKNKELENSFKEIQKLKSLDAKIIFTNTTSYDTIQLVTQDTLIVISQDTLMAKKFIYDDKWLFMKGLVKDSLLTFDTLTITNKYKIEVGDFKKNLFAKKEKQVFIINENPHTDTQMIQSLTFVDEQKWYERGIWKFLAGGLAVFVITRNI